MLEVHGSPIRLSPCSTTLRPRSYAGNSRCPAVQAEIMDISMAATVEHASMGILQIACFEARLSLDYE